MALIEQKLFPALGRRRAAAPQTRVDTAVRAPQTSPRTPQAAVIISLEPSPTGEVSSPAPLAKNVRFSIEPCSKAEVCGPVPRPAHPLEDSFLSEPCMQCEGLRASKALLEQSVTDLKAAIAQAQATEASCKESQKATLQLMSKDHVKLQERAHGAMKVRAKIEASGGFPAHIYTSSSGQGEPGKPGAAQ